MTTYIHTSTIICLLMQILLMSRRRHGHVCISVHASDLSMPVHAYACFTSLLDKADPSRSLGTSPICSTSETGEASVREGLRLKAFGHK